MINMNVEEFKIKNSKNIILGFGFNKGPLNPSDDILHFAH
jgi:hypothetical protein